MQAPLEFDPNDPFPLVDLKSVPYEEQKKHAAQVDEWLGLNAEKVESRLEREIRDRDLIREQWVGLPVQSLLTPYVEIRFLLSRLHELGCFGVGDCIVDLGAAYGRMGHVLHRHYPEVRFLGLEVCAPRVVEGRQAYGRAGIPVQNLVHADLLQVEFPKAQVYFLYDFGRPSSIQRGLELLQEVAAQEPVTVVGRGRSCRDQIERSHPWLSQVVPPIHEGHYGIYRSRVRS